MRCAQKSTCQTALELTPGDNLSAGRRLVRRPLVYLGPQLIIMQIPLPTSPPRRKRAGQPVCGPAEPNSIWSAFWRRPQSGHFWPKVGWSEVSSVQFLSSPAARSVSTSPRGSQACNSQLATCSSARRFSQTQTQAPLRTQTQRQPKLCPRRRPTFAVQFPIAATTIGPNSSPSEPATRRALNEDKLGRWAHFSRLGAIGSAQAGPPSSIHSS